MKKWLLIICLLATVLTIYAAGLVANRRTIYVEPLTLLSCDYEVNICNEVAVVKVTETFRQTYGHPYIPRYIFPLPEEATATAMRWCTDGIWRNTVIGTQPLRPDGNPGYIVTDLLIYLGPHPYYYDLPNLLPYNDTLSVEFTYLQILDYASGVAELFLKNDITVFQTAVLQEQSLQVNITSDRPMTQVQLVSHNPDILQHNLHTANIQYTSLNHLAYIDYLIRYTLDYQHPGTQIMSTFKDTVPDSLGRGFFAFYAEPDPSEADVQVRKVYSFLIDTSGSMSSDDKLVQAQEAANYVVDHLNQGDYFNLLTFSTYTQALWNQHRPCTAENAIEAHDFIANMTALGNTNIQLVFETAISQFEAEADSIANIIVFMTDGEPTEGLANAEELSAYVDSLIIATGTGIVVFSFGIGPNVNEDLLNLLSEHNHGTATMVGLEEIYAVVTDFYNTICNPTLSDPVFSQIPAGVVEQVYPTLMPNLYLGRQNVICGRYDTALPVHFELDGHIFSQDVTYNYHINLSNADQPAYDFLPQLWARQKIEALLALYYTYTPTEWQAIELRQQITQLSLMYSVLTIFDEDGPLAVPEEDNQVPDFALMLRGNYPNPFLYNTKISFQTGRNLPNPVQMRIYNTKGQLVRILARYAKTPGTYELTWDGMNTQGKRLSSGMYIYTLGYENTVTAGKMTLLK